MNYYLYFFGVWCVIKWVIWDQTPLYLCNIPSLFSAWKVAQPVKRPFIEDSLGKPLQEKTLADSVFVRLWYSRVCAEKGR